MGRWSGSTSRLIVQDLRSALLPCFLQLRSCPKIILLEMALMALKEKVRVSHSAVSDSLQPHRLYSPRNSPGQNAGVGRLSFLQGVFPTQGPNPGLLHSRWIPYQLSHKGSPRILEWVAYPFSSRSSPPRNQTGVSCIAGGFFTS